MSVPYGTLRDYMPHARMYRNKRLTETARDEPCMNCMAAICRTDTTVWAHSNLGEHGKGFKLKAHDCFGAFLGDKCHAWLDNAGGHGNDPTERFEWTPVGKAEMFRRAMDATYLHLWRTGKLRIA